MLRKVEKWCWMMDLHPESDQHQNLTTSRRSSLARAYHVRSTFIYMFVSYLADRRTHSQTHRVNTIPLPPLYRGVQIIIISIIIIIIIIIIINNDINNIDNNVIIAALVKCTRHSRKVYNDSKGPFIHLWRPHNFSKVSPLLPLCPHAST